MHRPFRVDPIPRRQRVLRRAFALALLAHAVRAQEVGSLTIRVRSGVAPIEHARVEAEGSAGETGPDGAVRLILSPGTHEVIVSHPAFEPRAVRATIAAGEDTERVVQLRPAQLPAEVVTVVASRSGRIVDDQPVRVETLPEEEIEENLTESPGDLSALLNELPGIRVQPAPTLGGGSLRLRGFLGRHTQVLADELPLFGEQPDVFGLLQVPPLDLAHVEVVKGPATTLYGGSAIGGVVNLVSRRPPAEPEALVGATSLGGADAVGFLPFQLGSGWAGTLLGGAHGQRLADVDGDGWADLPRVRRGSLRPRFFWNGENGGSLFLTVGAMREDRDGGTVEGGATPAGQPFRESLGTRRLDLGIVGRWMAGPEHVVGVRAAYADARRDLVFGGTEERNRRRFGLVEGTVSGHAKGHTWLAGAVVETDAFRARDVAGFDYTFTAPAVFVQDEFDLTPRFAISASARESFHSAYGTIFDARVSALVRPAARWGIRLSAGTGHAAPTPMTEETETVGLSRVLPPAGIAWERAATAMADVHWAGGPWEADVSAFGSELAHPFILRDTSPVPGMLQFVSAATPTRTLGGELLARYGRGPHQAILSYTYVRSVGESSTGPARQELPLTPRHAAEVAWIWEREGRGRFGVEASYVGAQRLEDDPYRAESRPFVLVDVLAELRVRSLAIFLNAVNLGDVRQTSFEPWVRPAPGPDGRWTTDVWAPLEGRVFSTGVRCEF